MDAVLQTMVDERIGPGERKISFERILRRVGFKDGVALRTIVDALTLGEDFDLPSGAP